MAAIDIGEAKALALRARNEARRLGGQALERATPAFGRLMEEPRSFLAAFRPVPPRPEPQWARLAGMAALGFVAGAAALGVRKAAVQAMTHHPADWLEALKADHRLVEKLFESILASGDSDRARRRLLLSKLTHALNRHALEEENVVYPALREANRELAAKRLAGEHFDIKSALHELAGTPAIGPDFSPRIKALRDLVAAHVREEEEDLYPAFRAGMSEAENLALTRAINREGLKLA